MGGNRDVPARDETHDALRPLRAIDFPDLDKSQLTEMLRQSKRTSCQNGNSSEITWWGLLILASGAVTKIELPG